MQHVYSNNANERLELHNFTFFLYTCLRDCVIDVINYTVESKVLNVFDLLTLFECNLNVNYFFNQSSKYFSLENSP